MSRTIKDTWRNDAKDTFTDVIVCDTLLPVDTVDNQSPLLFNVRPQNGYVIDLNKTRLKFKFRVQKLKDDKWVGLSADDHVCIYNNFGFSIFEKVLLNIAGKDCETSKEYSRINWIRNMYLSDAEQQKALSSSLFCFDEPGFIDMVTKSGTVDNAEYLRCSLIERENLISVEAPVQLNTFETGFLPDSAGFTLRMTPTESKKCILQTLKEVNDELPQPVLVKVKVTIEFAELHIQRIALKHMPKSVAFDYNPIKVQNFSLATGTSTFHGSLDCERLPDKILWAKPGCPE